MVQIDIKSSIGKELSRTWKADGVPYFLLLSDTGEELLRRRGGPPSYDDVLASLNLDS